jgi:type II secretory pathway pseudopilin PulG
MKHVIKGSTLIELLLYVSVVGIILGALTPAAWNVIEGGTKNNNQEEVAAVGRNIMERIKYAIRNAHDVSAISATSLTLINYTGSNTVIDQSGTNIRINTGAGAVNLNPATVAVTNLTFTDYRAADGTTENIQVELTLTDNYTAVRQEYTKTIQLQTSVELRSI